MYRVVKRDNSVAEFDIKKISEAIIKAFEATEKQYNNSVIDLLALKVTADFEPKIKDGLYSRGGHTGTAWRRRRARRAMQTWPRPTYSTASSGRSSAT